MVFIGGKSNKKSNKKPCTPFVRSLFGTDCPFGCTVVVGHSMPGLLLELKQEFQRAYCPKLAEHGVKISMYSNSNTKEFLCMYYMHWKSMNASFGYFWIFLDILGTIYCSRSVHASNEWFVFVVCFGSFDNALLQCHVFSSELRFESGYCMYPSLSIHIAQHEVIFLSCIDVGCKCNLSSCWFKYSCDSASQKHSSKF